ncbi:choice-of-anchor D domain-containing protein [Archangium gephyra]|uniref:choice-of-anchor D domain-containing protein n=1 Tax=Archangium gephyra TaxID=48 RepID=UPI0035D43FE8
MLRLNFLAAALCLAALASCAPSEPQGTVSSDSLRRTSTAVVDTIPFTVKWSGERVAGNSCLNCRTDWDYECVVNTGGQNDISYLTQTFRDPYPGAVVTGVKAKVYGRLIDTGDSDRRETLNIQLNGQPIGSDYTSADEMACSTTNKDCETPWEKSAASGSAAITGYLRNADNILRVGVTGSGNSVKYCLSHVELYFTYQPRTLEALGLTDGSLSFGKQKNGTISRTLTVKVKNTGEASVRAITPSIRNATGGTFTLSSTTPFDLGTGATSAPFSVTFTPTAPGGEASGILSFTSNEAGFPAGNPTLDIPLSGFGVASAADVSHESLTFASLRVGQTSTAQTVTVRNVGNVPTPTSSFNITGVSIGPDEPFDVTPKTGFPVAVVANTAGTPLSVTFKPTAEGVDQTGTLTIFTNDPDRLEITVALKGTGVKPTIALNPDPVVFGPQRVGTISGWMPLVVRNDGSERLDVSAVAIGSGAPFEVSSTTAFTVAPGATHTALQVRFKPVAEGVDQLGSLTFTTNEPGRTTAIFVLKGTGVKPTIALNPDPVVFGPQRVDSISEWTTLSVRNDGSERLDVSAVAIGSGPFEVSSNAGFFVASGATYSELKVRFKPTAAGVDQPGALTFTTNEPGRSTATFVLKGTGVKPTLVLDPSPVTFLPQRVDTISDWKTLSVRNDGTEQLDVSAVAIGSGPFEVSSNAGFTVAPGGTHTALQVRFKPTLEAADQPGVLTFTTNEPRRTTATFALSGSGVRPHLEVTPATTPTSPLTFDDQRVLTTSGPKTVTVSNLTGTGPIRITAVSTGSDGIFTVSPSDPFTLEKGESRPLSVTFRPTSETVASGTLTLATDYTPLSTVTVSLSGKGIKPTLELSTTSLSFGTQGVGSPSTPKPVTVRNIGSGTLRITSISVSSPSYKLDSMAPFELTESSREKTLSVTFQPLAQDSIPGSITLRTNDPENDPVTISLSGNGQTELKVTPSTIDFESVRVGAVGERQVTFTNEGPVAITLTKVLFISDAQFSVEGLGTPVELKPGFPSIPLKVKFIPTRAGDVSAVIRVESTANNSPHTLSVSGRGTEARVQLSLPMYPGQTALDFGDVEVYSTKQEMVRLTNTGGATLDVTTAKVVRRLSDGGTVVSTIPFEYRGPSTRSDIAPDGGYIEFPVAFTPPENAAFSATLVINSNAVNNPVELPLIGNGAAAHLELSRSSIAFGTQRLGAASPTQRVFITNRGKAALKIQGFSFTNSDFAVSSPTPLPSPSSPIVVPGDGGTLAVDLRFTPTALGVVRGSLTVLSNAIDSVSSLSLEGTGLDGAITVVEPTTDINFGGVAVGSSSPKALVRVKNTGDFRLTLISAGIKDPSEDNPFIITGFNSGLTLYPGDVHEFFVTFRPLVNGYQSALVTIQSDSWLNPQRSLTVLGTGEGAEVELLRSSINFGKANVGQSAPQTLSIRNRGVRTLDIHEISFEKKTVLDGGIAGTDDMSLDFNAGRTADGGSIFSGSGSVLLEPEASIVIDMKFSPTAVGLREARGVITSNAKTVRFDVTGQGTSPILKAEPAKLVISGVLLDNTSTAQQIKITNDGDGPVDLNGITLTQTGSAFTLTHSSVPIRLDPKAVETLLVTFRPTEAQPSAVAQLLVEPSLSSVPRILIPIEGRGVTQPITVESELDFGQQLIGSTSLPHTLHISNNTENIISLTGATVVAGTGCAQFKPEPLPTTSVELVNGEPVPLNVTFRPLDQSDVNCVLRLSFSQGRPIDVALHGKGIPTVLSINPSPLDFGGVRIGTGAREEPITLLNLSSDPITLAKPEVQFPKGEPFLFDWASLEGLVLQPGVPVVKKVKYEPMTESFSDATVYFGTTIPLKPRAVEFKLQARATRSVLSADVTHLDFGRVGLTAQAQTKTVTVTNKSAQPQRVLVKLKAIEASAFAFNSSGLSEAIPPEASATFSVAFDPDKVGEAENEVQVWVQDATEPELQIPVTGFGQNLTGSGSGCSCSSTEAGSAGMLMLLALVGLGSRRRKRE